MVALAARFSEPVIPKERIEEWLMQFPEDDREAALLLLEKVTFHSYPRLIRETQALHALLLKALADDGFDTRTLACTDFSRGFTCKSGDIISYIYRKANAIPSVLFKNLDSLYGETQECAGQFCDRALVILDDYIGTGSQFIFQLVARNPKDIHVLRGYRKIYLASIVTHDNAFEKLAMLRRGEYRKLIAIEEGQFPDYDWDVEEPVLPAALAAIDWSRVSFLCVEREHPLLSRENAGITDEDRRILGRFLSDHGDDSALITSYLGGHHTFFYGAPNSLSKVLYPLFSRVEDYSIYPMENFLADAPVVSSYGMESDEGRDKNRED